MKSTPYRRPIFQFFLGLFTRAETAINHVWGERWNFFYYLGSLPIILLFILLFTGLFMFIYYNMSVSSSYDSVKYMTEHAMFGRFMRNLHRYAADAMMFFVILHLLRILFEEKFQNHRTLAWITGLIILMLMLVQGITGYILPLDSTARFVMEKTSEILAGLKVFGDTLPRSFSSPALLGKWIMWVVLIVHLIIPLFFVLLLFIHLLRVSRAKLFPPKHITIAFIAILAIYTLVIPIPMAGKAEAEKLPQLLQPDWFYLFFAPVFENRLGIYIWFATGATVFGLFALPWLLKRRKIVPAVVTADKCTGCGLCAIDCPYQAMHMVALSPSVGTATSLPPGNTVERKDESHHKFLVSIDTNVCSGCGVCSGSCAYGAISFPRPTPRGLRLRQAPPKFGEGRRSCAPFPQHWGKGWGWGRTYGQMAHPRLPEPRTYSRYLGRCRKQRTFRFGRAGCTVLW
ncbi:MAG: cytochrome b N-terminal domain-containing protein [Turneriella sp.]